IDDERELRESVSYLVQSFSPVESGLQFGPIGINKNKASVLLHVEIKNCRIPGALKNIYVFQISMIKDKGKWLIRSSDEIVY
ncbi:MAG: hypothetical protein JW774_08485, partial [Candidatus Aureabacteria bacterium]|nr:hypothetical protein [Candidatus Auribacterota bacterium]